MNGHAGSNASTAFWPCGPEQFGLSSNMRLGDNSRELMVLATFACTTLKLSDGNANILARWQPPFQEAW